MTPAERQLADKARQFDPIRLILALEELGYPFLDIIFRSHYSNGSRPGIVESVEFREEPRQAWVTLNLGLLGGQSPLPSYFFRKVDRGEIDEVGFTDLIGSLNAILLRHFLIACSPEADPRLRKYRLEGRKDWLRTQRLSAPTALHWMAQLIFPELNVRVEKSPFRQLKRLRTPVLGKALLSPRTVFGGTIEVPVLGRRITLVANEEEMPDGTPWAREIAARLKLWLLPPLRNTGIELEVWLVVRSPGRGLALDGLSYLGYREFPGATPRPMRIRILPGN